MAWSVLWPSLVLGVYWATASGRSLRRDGVVCRWYHFPVRALLFGLAIYWWGTALIAWGIS